MLRWLLILAAAMTSTFSAAQIDTWKLDPAHSAAQFSVRHLGISTVRGAFSQLSGVVQYSPTDPGKSSVDVTIQAKSVDTRVEMRDNDLRSANYLDVEKYPTITFKSKRVEPAGSQLRILGDLTIHGVTKEVVLDVDGPSAPVTDPRGNVHMGASATAKINRKDFGVGGATIMVGDEISLLLDVELIKQLPASAAATSGK